MITPEIAEQLSKLVPPLQKIISNGVAKKGFHPVAIAHAMLLAGMLEMLAASDKEFTAEILNDMLVALEDENFPQDSLQ